MTTHSSIVAWRILWTDAVVHGVAKSQTWLSDQHTGRDAFKNVSTWFLNSAVTKFSSVAQLCPTLYNRIDHSTTGFPLHHQLRSLLNSCPSSRWSHPTNSPSVVPSSSCLQSFPASGSFPVSQFFTSGVNSHATVTKCPLNTTLGLRSPLTYEVS